MKKLAAILFSASFLPFTAAAAPEPMTLTIKGIADNRPIPSAFAYCKPDEKGKTEDGGNISPEISWSNAPAGTKSFAVIVVDRDVPARFDDANKDGKIISENFQRQDFYHWVLIDIPASITSLAEGQDSEGLTPGGKPLGQTVYGIRGQNDYAKVYEGTFGGYDGPCPPWNDQRLHHYHFRVYALDVENLGLGSTVNGKLAEKAISKHMLAMSEVVGTYTNYVRK